MNSKRKTCKVEPQEAARSWKSNRKKPQEVMNFTVSHKKAQEVSAA